MRLTHLDLCSGIGGFHLAAGWAGFETVGFSEVEPYCCALLAERWPGIRNYGDLARADFDELRGRIDVLSAGVPCQPASLAGKRRGSKDDRWLWPAVLDVVERIEPDWCIFENPVGILTLDEFGGILLRLESFGYQVRAFSVPANAVGAKHRRQRVFIIASRIVENTEMRRSSHLEREPGPSEEEGRTFFGNPGLATRTSSGTAVVAHRACELFDGSGHARSRRWDQSANGGEALADADKLDDDRSRSGTGEIRRKQREAARLPDSDQEALADADNPEQSGAACPQAGLRRQSADQSSTALADADRARLEEHQPGQPGQFATALGSGGPNGTREFEPGIRRGVDGLFDWPHPLTQERIPNRSQRLKALGNAVVPQQAYPFFEAIAQVMRR